MKSFVRRLRLVEYRVSGGTPGGLVTRAEYSAACARVEAAGHHPTPADLALLTRFTQEHPDLVAAARAFWAGMSNAELDDMIAAAEAELPPDMRRGGAGPDPAPAWWGTASPEQFAALETLGTLPYLEAGGLL